MTHPVYIIFTYSTRYIFTKNPYTIGRELEPKILLPILKIFDNTDHNENKQTMESSNIVMVTLAFTSILHNQHPRSVDTPSGLDQDKWKSNKKTKWLPYKKPQLSYM